MGKHCRENLILQKALYPSVSEKKSNILLSRSHITSQEDKGSGDTFRELPGTHHVSYCFCQQEAPPDNRQVPKDPQERPGSDSAQHTPQKVVTVTNTVNKYLVYMKFIIGKRIIKCKKSAMLCVNYIYIRLGGNGTFTKTILNDQKEKKKKKEKQEKRKTPEN